MKITDKRNVKQVRFCRAGDIFVTNDGEIVMKISLFNIKNCENNENVCVILNSGNVIEMTGNELALLLDTELTIN